MSENAKQILKQVFGYEEFHPGQEELVSAVLSGRDAVGIMPTGGGKSICYQLPAIMSKGMTIVISPLISLMSDQVQALKEAGVEAAYLNSSLDSAAFFNTVERAKRGDFKLLYVAPERLDTGLFEELASSLKINMIAVDEAHCISQWGQNFRPSYLKIAGFIKSMRYRPVVAAYTATATLRVRVDIINALGLDDPLVKISGFDRKNLYFEVRKPDSKKRELLAAIRERRGKNGIIYCSTRKNVESVYKLLDGKGYLVRRYHAGLSDAERMRNQDDFLYDRANIMVATNAFGMGIDKSNVAYVVHYNMPKSIEAYYQECGRAGRDGSDAECILFYSPADVRMNKFLIELSVNENQGLNDERRRELLDRDEQLLRDMTFYAFTDACLRKYILEYFGDKPDTYCKNCWNCNNEFKEFDATTSARAIVNTVYLICARGWPYGKSMVVDILKGAKNEKVRKAGFDRLRTFGELAKSPRSRLFNIIERMVYDELLEEAGDKYPTIVPGSRSEIIRSPEFGYIIKIPAERRAAAKEEPMQTDFDKGLYEQLRELRSKRATDDKVPAYIIFPDKTLSDMCRMLPTSPEAFLSISGVGELKLEKYGDAFMDVIKNWMESNGDSELE
ncbi:MAG: DNA helicase RecQ [Clostridiales Family XIII bacterium]|jgi:ATP-dependent DNA helicase RecQ|nr:DNA helicase RecQ [Clostridiales Family XIII bacterium]